MANRILRDGITASETIDVLTAEEEVFFYRLLTVCDDYGLMDARTAILKARCFPLKTYSEKLIMRWLNGLAAAGLIRLYVVSDRPYLSVIQWDQHQRVRNARHKYPLAPMDQLANISAKSPPVTDNSPQLAADRGETRPPRARADTPAESESNPYPNPEKDIVELRSTPAPAGRNLKTEAQEILLFLNAKAGRGYPPLDANLDLIAARLKEGATPAQCRQVIAKKAREWGGDEKMAEYLRPKTLFSKTNFAQYVGEIVP